MKFEQILILAVGITGLIYLLDLIFFKKQRMAKARKFISARDEIKDPILVEYSKAFFPVLLLVLVLRSFLAEPFRIPSSSMKPTLLEGDFIVVNKFGYGLKLPILGLKLIGIGEPKRGDVIVFRHTKSMDLIKRVVGLPGDHILYKDNTLYINGKPVAQEYHGKDYDLDIASSNTWPVVHKVETLLGNDKVVKHGIYQQLGVFNREYKYQDVVVPPGQYFVMGDNRDNSIDSRYWGFVQDQDIIGRAFATWMSWDSVNKDVRWDRIGKKIN